MRIGRFVALFLMVLCAARLDAQQAPKKSKHPAKRPTITARPIMPNGFRPTCNLDSGSVGFYFFPANLGAKWTLRTIKQVLDVDNKVLRCDTVFSSERVISDSNKTLQGLPVLRCESIMPYAAGHEAEAKKNVVEYYVDDSTVRTVFNHSVSNTLNHTLIVNPLRIGASWRDNADDTIRSTVIALDEPVTTPKGSYPKSMVVQSSIGIGMLSKYFVQGVGIVKTEFRGIPPTQNGVFVVTSELVALDYGDPNRSIKRQFQPAAPTLGLLPIKKSGKH